MRSPVIHAEPAYAKLNLCLRVVGRRSDGLHLLDSLVAFVDLADTILVEHADELSLKVSGPFAPQLDSDSDNLVLQAARRLKLTDGARLHLTKRIPVAAGLGGGSADAAATLRVLKRWKKLRLSQSALHRHALALGSDVPACLLPRPTRMTGIGDVLEPWGPLPSCGVVLANPGTPLLTADVFRTYARQANGFSTPSQSTAEPVTSLQELVSMLRHAGNDLEAAAVTLVPTIQSTIERLRNLPGALHAGMSGSGATCFALFNTRREAEVAQRGLGTGLWSHAGFLIPDR